MCLSNSRTFGRQLLVSNAKVGLSLCADSIAALTDFVSDLLSAPEFSSKSTASPVAPVKPVSSIDRSSVDLFGNSALPSTKP